MQRFLVFTLCTFCAFFTASDLFAQYRDDGRVPKAGDGRVHRESAWEADDDGPLEEHFSISIRSWLATLDADFDVVDEDAGVPRNAFDPDDDLDMDPTRGIVEFTVTHRMPWVTQRASWYQTRYDGRETLGRAITVDDIAFGAGTNLDSEVNLLNGNVSWDFRLVPPHARIDLSLTAGLSYLGTSVSIEDTGTGTDARIDEDLVYPVIGVRAAAPFNPWMYGSAAVRGFSAGFGSTQIDTYEIELEFGATIQHVRMGLGYKLSSFDFESTPGDTDVDIEWSLEGLYIHLGFVF